MEPLLVQVIAYAPTAYYHCQHCELTFKQVGFGKSVHREQAKASLPDDLRDEFHELADWLARLQERYGERIRVAVIDAVSIQGLWRSLRHGARRYPFVIVDGYRGQDLLSAESHVERALGDAEVADAKGGAASPTR